VPSEGGGGCGIRTREGVNPTRFPSPRIDVPDGPRSAGVVVAVGPKTLGGCRRTVATETRTETVRANCLAGRRMHVCGVGRPPVSLNIFVGEWLRTVKNGGSNSEWRHRPSSLPRGPHRRRGTVPPAIGLAAQLVRRGHGVHVLSDATVEASARSAGCAFSSMLSQSCSNWAM
jgi:hypothetical protein